MCKNIFLARSSLGQLDSHFCCVNKTAWWEKKKKTHTLRTDTRQTQGSSTPVPALALILQMKENLFFQRTQFAWTDSLWEKHI